MPKISKVEAELQEATGVKPKKGEALQDYLKRIHGAISDLDDAAWKKLSTPAMNWGNAATKAFDKDKPLPEFEADADDAKPAKGKAAAAKGDDEDPGEGNDDDADGAADDETENSDDAEGDDAEAAAEDKTVSKTKTTKGGAAAKTPAKKAAAPAKGKDKPEPKAETKKAPAAPAKKKAATGTKPGQKGDGYKGHRVGSNKETVHKVYDDKGRDAAIKKAAALELADNTARSWISSWGPSDADKGKAKK